MEKLHKTMTALAEVRPGAAFISFDARNAFNAMSRISLCQAVVARVPRLARVVESWYADATEHVRWDEDGEAGMIRAERGVDQGCPLSPAFFALAVAPVLEQLEGNLRSLDPHAHVFAYLDDIYVVVDPSVAPRAVLAVRDALASVRLELNLEKTAVWTPDPSVALPEEMASQRVPELRCLGANVPFVDVAEEALGRETTGHRSQGAAAVGHGSSNETAESALRMAFARFLDLRKAGLPAQCVLLLARTYFNGAITHLLRASLQDQGWCQACDALAVDFVQGLLSAQLDDSQRVQVFLSLKVGGLGFTSVSARRAPAFVASWEHCFAHVAAILEAPAAGALLARMPQTRAALTDATNEMYRIGAVSEPDWPRRFQSPLPRRQKEYSGEIQIATHRTLLTTLTEDDQVDLRSAGGKSGAFLLTPTKPTQVMGDTHLAVAVRRRLRVPHPAQLTPDRPVVSHCQRWSAERGRPCGQGLDSRGHHNGL